jgi:hypothetical protein
MITSKKNKKKKKKGPPQIQKDPILLYGPDDPMFPKWTYNAKYHYPEHCRWRHPEPYTVKCPECDELAALRTEAENSKSQIRQNLWADHSEAWRTFKDGGYYGFDGVNKGYSPDQVMKDKQKYANTRDQYNEKYKARCKEVDNYFLQKFDEQFVPSTNGNEFLMTKEEFLEKKKTWTDLQEVAEKGNKQFTVLKYQG